MAGLVLKWVSYLIDPDAAATERTYLSINLGLTDVDVTEALRQLGLKVPVQLAGKVTLVGFDHTADLGQNVREGAIDSLVIQDPYRMGYDGVKTIVDKLAGQMPARRIDTGVKLLTKENQDTPDIQKLTK